jgi:hypothetical protein
VVGFYLGLIVELDVELEDPCLFLDLSNGILYQSVGLTVANRRLFHDKLTVRSFLGHSMLECHNGWFLI